MNMLKPFNRFAMGLLFCLPAFIQTAQAGSYEDFFSAIEQDKPEVIQKLLNRGFDPNTVNPKGVPGLLLATQKKSLAMLRVLSQAKGVDLNITNPQSENSLMLAAIQNQLELAQLLIDQGAEVNKTGWTPLHYASTKGHIDMMRLLMENDAYLDAESPNGTTPLMMAAHYGTAKAVKLLLEEGADPRIKNSLGLSALDFALHGDDKLSAEYIQAFLQVWQQRYPEKPVAGE